MKQAEIWDINFNPTKRSEQRGIRPGVIISGNAMNDNFGLVIVCPLTTKIKNYMGNIVLPIGEPTGLSAASEVIVFQIRALSKERLVKKRGAVSPEQFNKIIEGLNEVLKY